jgi:hypothetical protein
MIDFCIYILKLVNAIKGWQEVVNALIFVKVVPYLTISNCIYVISCLPEGKDCLCRELFVGFNIESKVHFQ